MKRLFLCLMGLVLALGGTGCSAAAFWLSGCGNPDADLVIRNDSRREVWSIELNYGNETYGVQNTRDRALMKQGESYGLPLEEGTEQVTVILSDRLGRELARQAVDFAGDRLCLILEPDGSLSVGEDSNV